MNAHTCKISCYLHQYTRIFKVLCQNYICPYSKYLLPKITYAHSKYFINIQTNIDFCYFIHIYLYIHAYLRANFMLCTHLHFFKGIFMPTIYTLKGNSTLYVHFGMHSRAIFTHVYIHKALDHLFKIYMFYLKSTCLLLAILYIHVHGE